MKERTRMLVAGILLLCFSVFIVPNELIHAFYGHEDSHHGLAFPKGKPTVDARHVHCAFLTYDSSAFTHEELQPLLHVHEISIDLSCTAAIEKGNVTACFSSLRAPPAV